VVAASDYVRAVADLIRPYVPHQYVALGTDGFGRSDTRAALRSFFEVDAKHICVAALAALDPKLAAAALHRYGIDGVATLTRDGKIMEYVFQVKNSVTKSALGALSLAFGKENGRRLLVTDYVPPPLADELRRRHIQFIDAAGNAYLDRRGLMVLGAGGLLAAYWDRKRRDCANHRPQSPPRYEAVIGTLANAMSERQQAVAD